MFLAIRRSLGEIVNYLVDERRGNYPKRCAKEKGAKEAKPSAKVREGDAKRKKCASREIEAKRKKCTWKASQGNCAIAKIIGVSTHVQPIRMKL